MKDQLTNIVVVFLGFVMIILFIMAYINQGLVLQ
jgi:hypothetical protein